MTLGKAQWSTLVTRRYMITMMLLLCYVNLSGMSLECIVIVLMNNSLLGGQFCTDYVDIQQNGNNRIGRNRLAIIPRLNFTCNGTITSIRARVEFDDDEDRIEYPSFQIWRLSSTDPLVYNKTGEVELQSNQVSLDSNDFGIATINLTGNNTIEVQSGDVVGYYHPPQTRYQVRYLRTDGYILYRSSGLPAPPLVINLDDSDRDNDRQPLIQFTIGKPPCNVIYITS